MSSDPDEADHELDVRELDGPPFDDIMAALDELEDGETLLLINSFEPGPLYPVLEQRGFTYDASQPAPDCWHVLITPA